MKRAQIQFAQLCQHNLDDYVKKIFPSLTSKRSGYIVLITIIVALAIGLCSEFWRLFQSIENPFHVSGEDSQPNISRVEHKSLAPRQYRSQLATNLQFQSQLKNIPRMIQTMSDAGIVSPDELRQRLSDLNAQFPAINHEIYKYLRHAPKSDRDVHDRIRVVEYLNYRMRFDENARDVAVKLIHAEIPYEIDARYAAAGLGDLAEIFGALAASDPERARGVFGKIKNKSLRKYSFSEATHNLAATKGWSDRQVKAFFNSNDKEGIYDPATRI